MKLTFLGFDEELVLEELMQTLHTCIWWVASSGEKIKMSSRYTKTNLFNISFTRAWNAAGVLVNQKA